VKVKEEKKKTRKRTKVVKNPRGKFKRRYKNG